jgi:ABC-type Fe3+/spermidine/putrescine transport system ATPase subunit
VPAILLRGVSKHYGARPALRGLDLEIGPGEFFCLLGPSGCGKTTTLNLIGGFVAPSSGSIHIHGTQVDRLPPYRRDVNTVFQSYALFPHMTVEQNVGFGLRMKRVDRRETRARVGEALALVGLEGEGSRLPAELSGGQQQRVAVARALVNRPAVLLLDEPLGALDLKLRKRLQLELAEIHSEVGTVFVYVTHDQEEALVLSDRLAVMREGRVEQVGSPSEIYHWPRSRFVAEFIGESNFLPVGFVRERAGSVPGDARAGVVMLRPEAITVITDEADGGFVRGDVVHVSFLGSCTRVTVRCDGCPDPLVSEIHGGGAARALDLAAGQTVHLSWERGAGVVIEDQASSSEPAVSAESKEVATCTRE